MSIERIVKPHPSDAGFQWEVKLDGERRGFGWCSTEDAAHGKINAVIEEQKLEDEGKVGAGVGEGGRTGTDRREGARGLV